MKKMASRPPYFIVTFGFLCNVKSKAANPDCCKNQRSQKITESQEKS
jgi:hypothetical protein